MFIEQPPQIIRKLYPSALWRMDENNKSVYLTFDDGPIPEVTPWVLDLLEKYDIKATFFLVGDNISKYPDVFNLLKSKGHRLGNHTFNHIRGFEYDAISYMNNTEKADKLIHSDLFRPPHGHMTLKQYNLLKKKYKIVMWDLVTRDYSKRMTPQQVFGNIVKYVRNGSIITFHDSLKAWNNGNLPYALPKSIEYLLEKGYKFNTL